MAARKRSIADIVGEHLARGRTQLPVYDQIALELQGMLQRREFDVDKVEDLIASDPAYSSALLRLSNSTFFGGLEKVVTVRDAIVRLGIRQVARLVVLTAQRQNFKLRTPGLRPMAEDLWRHTVGCAQGSQWLAEQLGHDELTHNAFLAGLFHDIGKLFLLRVVDDVLQNRRYRFKPSRALVLGLLDDMHTEQGYELMKQWSIPDVYCDVVLNHHLDTFDESDTLLACIRLVDRACNKLGLGLRGEVEFELSTSCEAQSLHLTELQCAALEIKLEDAMHLAAAEAGI